MTTISVQPAMLPSPTIAPFGSWQSPITAEFVVSDSVGLDSLSAVDGAIYWIESRSNDKGRNVIVRLSKGGDPKDVLPAPYNARSRVHEYGGGSYTVSDGIAYFSNIPNMGVYFCEPGTEPQLIVAVDGLRFADLVYDKGNNSLIAICEDHRDAKREPVNLLVRIDIKSGAIMVLASGDDFYASPKLSGDGSRLAWLSWNHPNMPWDGTTLWTAKVAEDGKLTAIEHVAGGTNVSIFQPEWSPDGLLYFVSDRSGWWNIYRQTYGDIEPVWLENAEFGVPQWVFGQSTFGFQSSTSLFCTFVEKGVWKAATVDLITLEHRHINLPYTSIHSVAVDEANAYFVGASPSTANELVALDLFSLTTTILKKSSPVGVDEEYISHPQSIEFPTTGGTAYAIFYPPKNDAYAAPNGELPPLLVSCHGGPTSAAYPQLNPTVLYWTSRGFAFVSVNYRGSTGCGREYREQLSGNWGVVDVADCVNAALYLAKQNVVDGNRMTIHGGSAGGYIALAALTFYNVFAAGASLYGVSDIVALATDTHKFESRYLDRLIGPYPEAERLYVARSPINFTEKISRPIIFFQGFDDKVVPPSQTELMVKALIRKGIPVAYIPFEGEGHGFKDKRVIIRTMEAMLYFYRRVFEIEIAEEMEAIDIVGTI